MYWSLQQQAEDADSFPSPASTVTTVTPEASPVPSVCGEDESYSSLNGDFSNLSVDDTTSDTTVTSQLEIDGVVLDELF
jgi:plastin-1